MELGGEFAGSDRAAEGVTAGDDTSVVPADRVAGVPDVPPPSPQAPMSNTTAAAAKPRLTGLTVLRARVADNDQSRLGEPRIVPHVELPLGDE